MYEITASESKRSISSVFETKALLYMASFHPESKKMEFFIIDFFNDVSATTRFDDRIWDVQSKGSDSQSPKTIGHNLVTLYKNYLSDFNFCQFVLFVKGVSSTVRKNNSLSSFYIDNVKPNAIDSIIEGLNEEALNKTYIDSSKVSIESIKSFLSNVLFVIDDKDEVDYIRPLIHVNSELMPDVKKLKNIFEEIRSAQSKRKDRNNIEGVKLQRISDYKLYNRHIGIDEIRLLVFHRVLDYDLSSNAVPKSFIPCLSQTEVEEMDDVIEDCKAKIARTLFDNKNASNYWALFENICIQISENPKNSPYQVFDNLDKDILMKNHHLDVMSTLFLISVVKDGIRVC